MIQFKYYLISLLLLSVSLPEAQASSLVMGSGTSYLVARSSKATQKKRRSKRVRRTRSRSNDLVKALRLAKQKRYQEASTILFSLAHSPRYRSQRMRIKYLLGLMLYQMKMYQSSAFQFISVIKASNSKSQKYLRLSLEKLSLAADALGDETLLNYAISRVNANSFPRAHRDMLYYRIGEFHFRNGNYTGAASNFSKVDSRSRRYGDAKYMQATAYAIQRKNRRSIRSFDSLIDSRITEPVTDKYRVAGILGKARLYYQAKDWDKALEVYRQVPRDSLLWHETLFETSWAMLRSGRFRSALSNFQSLHSAYYDKEYLPESLLLRSIVYLYICQYDEMEKVLNLFSKIYSPILKKTNTYLRRNSRYISYYNDFMDAYEDEGKNSLIIPYIVANKIAKEGDIQRSRGYIKGLLAELKRIQAMPSSWRVAGVGKYSKRTVERRIDKAKKRMGRQVRAHMRAVRTELIGLFEQEGFVRYEMINGQKEILKKRVAGKELPTQQIDEDSDRDFYVQNGYQYWKFDGEYWLDELGNYYYVGTQSCR